MSILIDTFSDFLENDKNIKNDILDVLNKNSETFFLDLNSVKEQNHGLFIDLHKDFSSNYKSLKSAFEIFTLKNFNRKLDLSFYNCILNLKIREIKSNFLGNLISFTGTVTRTSQIRPELVKATFRCKECNTLINDVEQDFKFTEPIYCPNTSLCTNRSNFELILEKCEFSNWQKVIVQENTEEIPKGSLPRNLDLIIRNELCEKIKPGSHLKFTGFPFVIPQLQSIKLPNTKSINQYKGIEEYKQKRTNTKELNYKIGFLCIHTYVEEEKKSFDTEVINKIQNTPDLYNKLSDSLFPNIHGHLHIKNSILLMLVGGNNKKDINTRNDINILLVGDPGTAKSQFLKQTSSLMPRSIYTSGKSTSACGLTASVIKDSENSEFTIEAGALMLADEGVCCIDEFDKMNYKDQVSIHEAMEQQTITISKAGINATLNSRTSILAAANPIKGRYDKRKTLKQNVNLGPTLMSRFDLYFVLIDKIDKENDKIISKYILNNHLGGEAPKMNYFTLEETILYIEYCKNRVANINKESIDLLTEKYISLRQESLINSNNYKMTIRHLESLIRLSEALAKLHNSDVTPQHVNEAYRLLKSSLVEIKSDDIILCQLENKQNSVISNKDYLKIMNGIIYIIKSNENMNKEELILKYLEMIEDTIESRDQLNLEKNNTLKVIEYLIENEGVLYLVNDKVYIHPSYE